MTSSRRVCKLTTAPSAPGGMVRREILRQPYVEAHETLPGRRGTT